MKERVRRNRTGGVIDRRFGENDPGMDPEERMLERFAREKQVCFLARNCIDVRNGREIRRCIIWRRMCDLPISDNHLPS